jgi:hypothetical protein
LGSPVNRIHDLGKTGVELWLLRVDERDKLQPREHLLVDEDHLVTDAEGICERPLTALVPVLLVKLPAARHAP